MAASKSITASKAGKTSTSKVKPAPKRGQKTIAAFFGAKDTAPLQTSPVKQKSPDPPGDTGCSKTESPSKKSSDYIFQSYVSTAADSPNDKGCIQNSSPPKRKSPSSPGHSKIESSKKASPSKQTSHDSPDQMACSVKGVSEVKRKSPPDSPDPVAAKTRPAKSARPSPKVFSPNSADSSASDQASSTMQREEVSKAEAMMPGLDETTPDVYRIPMDQVKGQSLRERLAKRGSPTLNLAGDVKSQPTHSQSLQERLAKRKLSFGEPTSNDAAQSQWQPSGHSALASKKIASAKMELRSVEQIAESNEEWHAKDLSSLSGMSVHWRAFFNVAGARNVNKLEAIAAAKQKGKGKGKLKSSSKNSGDQQSEQSVRWEQHFAEPPDSAETTETTPLRHAGGTPQFSGETSPATPPHTLSNKAGEVFRTPTPLTPARTGQNSEGARLIKSGKDERKASQPQGEATRSSPGSGVKSAAQIKTVLIKHGIDLRSFKEDSELQSVWERFQDLRKKSLAELRKTCVTSGCAKLPSNVDGCLQFLLNPKDDMKENSSPPLNSTGTSGAEVDPRQQGAAQEARRMLSLSKWSFASNLAWGCSVLGAASADIPAVQRAHRALMKKLHPDKVGHSPEIAEAIELAREARDTCERALSQQTLPSTPLHLKSTVICSVPGNRRVKLQWEPPADITPVRRYVVSAVDAKYGRAITVATLEPDYSEELKRFVSMEELRSYVVAEQDLHKVPGLFLQPFITLQVATANEAGQSHWASLRVPLAA